MIILERKDHVTVQVFYYRLDYRSILQEFVWQCQDVTPKYPRVYKFLEYWKENIDAVISEVLVTGEYEKPKLVHANYIYKYN